MSCTHVCRACGTVFANGKESEVGDLRQRLDQALAERDSYMAAAQTRWGPAREVEALLGVGDTTGEEQLRRAVERVRELEESERERDAAVEEARRLAELAMEARGIIDEAGDPDDQMELATWHEWRKRRDAWLARWPEAKP